VPFYPSNSADAGRWRRLIPLVYITYSLAYLDRSNYSIGVASGLGHDLGLTSGSTALLGALFFAGYFVFQFPAAYYAEHKSITRLIFWCTLCWGIFATAQGLITSLWLLMIDRFLLGAVEAAVVPALLIYLTRWFTRVERGRANTYLILGNPITVMWLSAASGYLISATSWRWMFIIEGLPALVWAFVLRSALRDRPSDATWLIEQKRIALERRLAAEQAQFESAKGGYKDALRSAQVWALVVQYTLWAVGLYGFVFWLPTILKTAQHAGIGEIGLLSALPYGVAAIAMVIVSKRSDRSGRRRSLVLACLLSATVLFGASVLVGTQEYWLSYVFLVFAGALMYAPYGVYYAIFPESLPQSLVAPAFALVNAGGAVGGFVGAYAVGWLQGGLGNAAAFSFMAVSLLLSSLTMFLVKERRRSPDPVLGQPAAEEAV
jgi:sugar phosphate permease